MSNPISAAAVDMVLNDLLALANRFGIRVIVSTELNAEDDDSAQSVTLISPRGDSKAKFMAGNMLSAAQNAMNHIKATINGSQSLPYPPQPGSHYADPPPEAG